MIPHSMILRSLQIACVIAGCSSCGTALQPPRLLSRDINQLTRRGETCPANQPNSCQAVDSKLPGDFCCDAQHQCISLDSSSSALCCPKGLDCESIQPISCDVSLQDPVKTPNTQVYTTKLSSKLPTCGNACCPFGYTCHTNQTTSSCLIDLNTSSLASSSSSQSTIATATPTASGIDSTRPQPTTQCERFPAAAIAAGFFPGMLAGALMMLFAILFFGSKRSNERPGSKGSSSIYKPYISARKNTGAIVGVSEPIPLYTQHSRTDFLRRTTSRARSLFSGREAASRPGTSYDFNSTGGNWKMPTPPAHNNIPPMPDGPIDPVTPQRQKKSTPRVPSTESIKVYTPSPGPQAADTISPPSTGSGLHQRGGAPAPALSSPGGIGSPFKTPPAAMAPPDNYYRPYMTSYPDAPVGHDNPPGGETLSPMRYDDGRDRRTDAPSRPTNNNNNYGDHSATKKERPTTTFTEMLASIDFPDPGNSSPPPRPVPPTLPRPLNINNPTGKNIRPGGRM